MPAPQVLNFKRVSSEEKIGGQQPGEAGTGGSMRNYPVFNARLIATASFDKLYRIYLVGDQLYFVRIGGQGGLWEGLTHQLGIVGYFIEKSIKKRAERKEKTLIEGIDRMDPEHMLATHKDNFRLGSVEVQAGAVDPPSFFATHGPHVGRWHLELRDGRELAFQFEKADDMRIALDVLPGFVPSGFRVGVRWNPIRLRYEKREDAA